MSTDEIPVKSLDVQVNVFSVQVNPMLRNIMIAKNMLTLHVMGFMVKSKSKNRIYVPEALRKYVICWG